MMGKVVSKFLLMKGTLIAFLFLISLSTSAFALQQTDNDRTPTWTTFKVRTLGVKEEGAFFGLGAFCQFPEQFAPKRPNPRWEFERPFRKHFVEHLNPAFSGCFLKPFIAMPDFYDFNIPAELQFEFEKKIPSGFQPFSTGNRTAVIRTNFAEKRGRVFAIPELQGSPDQNVILRLFIFGKKLTEIEFRIDSNYTLNFHQYRRENDDQTPYLVRQWESK